MINCNDQSLSAILFKGYKALPNKYALIDNHEKLTYKELFFSSSLNAQNLTNQGINQFDRVILIIENSVRFIEAYFSILKAGAIVVPLDPNISEVKLEKIIDHSEPACIYTSDKVYSRRFQKSNYSSIKSFMLFKDKKNTGPTHDEIYKVHYHCRPENMSNDYECIDIKKDQTAVIIYTTGTSGEPKGVALSHDNIMSTINNISQFIKYNSKDKEVITLPLSHSFGLNHVLCNLNASGTACILDGIKSIKTVLKMISDNATGFPGSPSTYGIILDRYESLFQAAAQNLKFIVINSSPLPVSIANKIFSILPKTKLYVYYGLTEASRSTFILHSKDKQSLLKSVGKASPNVEVAVIDEKNNIVLRDGEGEVLIRGRNVMKGYLNDQIKTESSFFNGWLKTGDIGYIDKSGYLFIKGRIKDMINIGGLKTSSGEINEVYSSIEGVDDFYALSIPIKSNVGVTEKIIALVKFSNKNQFSHDILVNYGRKKLEEFKLPKEFYIVNAIPRSETGKPLKEDIKEILNGSKLEKLL